MSRPSPLDARRAEVVALYETGLSVHAVGAAVGANGDSVWRALRRWNITRRHQGWTAQEDDALRACYADPEGVDLADVAAGLGRSRAAVACRAEELGLTTRRGHATRTAAARANQKAASRGRWTRNPHPRGMLGKRHSAATKQRIAEAGMGRPVSIATIEKSMRTRFLKYGAVAPRQKRGSWKAGWRTVGGQRFYARSRWEANYARWLEWLRERGEIAGWEHEPTTFWFEIIKRGVRSFLIDFRVDLVGGGHEWHEVKGWMDPRSVTKIKRMKKCYPHERLVVIGQAWFADANRKLSGLIPGWERKEDL